jgi:hypothetical protein
MAARIRQLERDVEELKSLLRGREPLTAASKGWLLSNMTIPSPAFGTVHIGANGGQFYSVESGGVVKRMYPQVAAASVTSFTLGNAPASYSQVYAQQQSVGIQNLWDGLTTALANFKSSGVMSSF